MVEIKLNKWDSVWIVFVFALIGVGFVYGNSSTESPDVMGHSWENIDFDMDGDGRFDDAFCHGISGHACGVDNEGPGITPVNAFDHTECYDAGDGSGVDVYWFDSDGNVGIKLYNCGTANTVTSDFSNRDVCYLDKYCASCQYNPWTPEWKWNPNNVAFVAGGTTYMISQLEVFSGASNAYYDSMGRIFYKGKAKVAGYSEVCMTAIVR
jgi:hypothetical protein